MKILAITARADIGGGPEHLYQLAKAYGDRAQISIACPDDAPYFARYGALPNVSEVIRIPHRAFHWGVLLQLRRYARSAGIEVIHSHGKGAGIYGRLLAALTGLPCVHTFHGLHVGEYGRAKRAVYLGIERVLGWFTRAGICVSEGEAAQIKTAGFLPAAKCHVVPNGVVVPEVLTQRAAPAEPLRIVAVNRFDPQKNPGLLVDIAKALRARIGDAFRLNVMGQGDQFDAIQSRIAHEGLTDQVVLLGPSSTPRMILQDHDLFLSTSLWEGMPLAVLEAMSEGLVPVVTDVVGNRDVVAQEKTGLLYPAEDPDAGAQAVLAAAVRWSDLRSAAYAEVAEKYSVARMADETWALTTSVLRASRR